MLARLCLILMLLVGGTRAQAADWVGAAAGPGSFPLAADGAAARIVTDPADHAVVQIAATDLRADIARVTGASPGGTAQVWIGTLGRNAAIDGLVASGRIDVSRLRGAWESFLIQTIDHPAPGVRQALLIIGSDRRGTAYGAYELSQAIGVSPWHWWADVTPLHRDALHVSPGTRRFGPPSVRYRGIFLNDEDWGLVPWAAGTHAPDEPPLGPKSYARVFELLLRLKANLLWPAMHRITRPFNADPANAALADRYAIVMGSSHAEPMLRNNVGEWTAPVADFDYAKNPGGVGAYWRERVATNARYESVWTLGMRGIHDSGMVGPTSMADKRATLERIFADQRAMLHDHGIEHAPQVFMPYKEVLDIYRAGLTVPDDVTLMWPDDNFGYIRRFPDAAERARPGGSGIYYHLSYLGAPLSYLWLSTTPPALIREEMGRAWDRGARMMWVANVGDLKPAELATDYFLRLAWDVEGTRARPIDDVVAQWADKTIAPGQGARIAPLFAAYHRLNFARRPEHLQWYLPGEKARPSPLDIAQADARLAEFARLEAATDALAPSIPAARQDAFFELLAYPVHASAAANRRVFAAEAHDRLRDTDLAGATARGRMAWAADAQLRALTRRYNRDLAGGKWRGMMAMEPADGQWRSYRMAAPLLPSADAPLPGPRSGATSPAPAPTVAPMIVAPDRFAVSAGWRKVDGLGRQDGVLASDGSGAARVRINLPQGSWRMVVDILPTYADADGGPLRLVVAVDGRRQRIDIPRTTGDRDWADAVLDNRITMPVPTRLDGGAHRIALEGAGEPLLVEAVRFLPERMLDGSLH